MTEVHGVKLSDGLANPLSAVVCIASCLGVTLVHAAAAQSVLWPPPTTVHRVPSYCQKSTLTGAEFVKSIQHVIAHGDLTDIAFTEKAFGTKFNTQSGESDSQRLVYQSSRILDSPIAVRLVLQFSRAKQLDTGWIAYMDIVKVDIGPPPHDGPNFIGDCLHITAPELSSSFGEGGEIEAPTDGAPFAVFHGAGFSEGKNDSRLSLNFRFNWDNEIVTAITIVQATRE